MFTISYEHLNQSRLTTMIINTEPFTTNEPVPHAARGQAEDSARRYHPPWHRAELRHPSEWQMSRYPLVMTNIAIERSTIL